MEGIKTSEINLIVGAMSSVMQDRSNVTPYAITPSSNGKTVIWQQRENQIQRTQHHDRKKLVKARVSGQNLNYLLACWVPLTTNKTDEIKPYGPLATNQYRGWEWKRNNENLPGEYCFHKPKPGRASSPGLIFMFRTQALDIWSFSSFKPSKHFQAFGLFRV